MRATLPASRVCLIWEPARAVMRFQQDFNQRNADDPTIAQLPVLDPNDENAVVDSETIRQLMQ